MSIFFDPTLANAYASFTAGSAGAVGTGARTLAALVRPKSGNNNAGFLAAMASSTIIVEIFEDTLLLYGEGDFSSGFGPGGGNMSQDTWYVVAMTHPGTSAPWRMHIWPYAADGSGTMSHGVATGAGNHTNTGSAATELRVGGVDVKGNGDIAVVAYWTRECSDADLDGLKSNLLTAWSGLANGGPAELIHFQSWNGTTGATIAVGTSTFSSLTGTGSVGAEPPSFSYSLSGPVVGSTAPRLPPRPLFDYLAAATEQKWRAGSSVTTVTATGSGATVAHETTTAVGTKVGSGTGTAQAHPTTTGAGSKTTTGSAAGGARAVVAATGLKVASGTAGPQAHVNTVDIGTKAASGTGTAVAHEAGTAAGTKVASGTAAVVAHEQVLAVKVGTAASGSGTASARAAVVATGAKVGAGTGVVVAHAATVTTGQKAASATAGPQAHVVTAGTGVKVGAGVAGPQARASTVDTGRKLATGAGLILAHPYTVGAGQRTATGNALVVAHVMTVGTSGPPTAPLPEPAPLIHVVAAPLVHVVAAPLVHVSGG